MISCYIALKKRGTHSVLLFAVPLLLALFVDSGGFAEVIAHYRKQQQGLEFVQQLKAKLSAGTIYALWFSLYSTLPKSLSGSRIASNSPRQFLLEAEPPILRKALSLLNLLLTLIANFVISNLIMRERGKDADRTSLSQQASDPATQGWVERHRIAEEVTRVKSTLHKELIHNGLATFHQDMPELIENHLNEWVAYRGGERLGFASTQTELYMRLEAQGIPEDELTVRLVNEDSLYESDKCDSSAHSLP
jgi:hypothetical protein